MAFCLLYDLKFDAGTYIYLEWPEWYSITMQPVNA